MKIVGGKIYIKMLFFGTALAGKTTSLEWLFDNLIPFDMRMTNQVRSVKTSFGQTLLFDFVPIQVSKNIIMRIYTTTGQDYYTSTRKMLFQEVDGIFFVVDSQKKELEHNAEFVYEFQKYLDKVDGVKDSEVIVLYNKQDLEEVYTPEELAKRLGLDQYHFYSTCALTGQNLQAAFTTMVERILRKIKERRML